MEQNHQWSTNHIHLCNYETNRVTSVDKIGIIDICHFNWT